MTPPVDDDTPVAISLSGGASSEWLLRAMLEGKIPRPRHVAAFFAETGCEHEWTYERIAELEELCKAHGVPFFRARTHRTSPVNGEWDSIIESITSAFLGERTRIDNPPFWTENPGGGRGKLTQKCTQIWKSRPLRVAQAAWLKEIGQRKRVVTWIGFAGDEVHRANKAIARVEAKWATLAFPAISLRVGREEQRADIARWTGRPAPRFSMCIICPFKSAERWKQTSERDVKIALDVDEMIRDGMANVGVDEPCYLYDGLIPVRALLRGERAKVAPLSNGANTGPGCDGGHCFL